MRIDVNAWIGAYPHRHLPRHSVDALLADMDQVGIEKAWVASLPAAFHRDPGPENAALYQTLTPHSERLSPIPTVNPALPHWEDELNEAHERGGKGIRVYPTVWGMGLAGGEMRVLAAAAAAANLPIILTVKFEDARQRHPRDAASDLDPAGVRQLIRADPEIRLVVTSAGRSFVEEVHWGSAAAEATRLWWDVSHIWGPPQDDLLHLVRELGAERFVFGTHVPLRIAEATLVKLELLDIPAAERRLIESENAKRYLSA